MRHVPEKEPEMLVLNRNIFWDRGHPLKSDMEPIYVRMYEYTDE